MKTYQFTTVTRIEAPETAWDGYLYPGSNTPVVTAETPTEAIYKLTEWCKENRCAIYEVKR